MAKAFYTPKEVAEFLKVDNNTVYLWLKNKKIKSSKVGGKWLIPVAQFQEFEVSK